jgi:hypothetical protein
MNFTFGMPEYHFMPADNATLWANKLAGILLWEISKNWLEI